MAVIEEHYIIFNPAEPGGEVGFVTMRVRLEGGRLVSSELIFDGLDGQPLQPGRYALDFIPRDLSERPRSVEAPAFEGIAHQQGRVVNDRRPALRIVRDEDRAASLHALTGMDH